jgi:hypothetical protein
VERAVRGPKQATRDHRARLVFPRRVLRVQHRDLLRVFCFTRSRTHGPGSAHHRRGRAQPSRRPRRARRHGFVRPTPASAVEFRRHERVAGGARHRLRAHARNSHRVVLRVTHHLAAR